MNKAELVAEQLLRGNLNKKEWGDLLYNVRVYGAKGDGIADDTLSIRKAIDAIVTSEQGRGMLTFPPGQYRITDTLEIDLFRIQVECVAATIWSDGPAIAIRLRNNYTYTDFSQAYDGLVGNSVMGPRGIHVKWKSGAGAVGVRLEGESTFQGASLLTFEGCAIDGFPICIQSFSHSWNWNFIGGYLRGELLLDVQDGGEDYFERIGFYGTTFGNHFGATTGVVCWRADGILNFVNCSFDFLTNIATMHQGRAAFYGCHFESDKFDDYWFIINNDGTEVMITDSEFFPPGMTKPLFFVNDNVKEGGLFLTNPHFTLSQVNANYHEANFAYDLVAGDGSVNATGVVTYANDWPLNVGVGVNELPSWDFEGVVHGFTFTNDNLGVAGSIVTTESHTPTQSMQLSSNGVFPAQTAYLDVRGSKVGKRISHSFWAKIPNGVPLYSETICMTDNDQVIKTFTVTAIGTGAWKFYYLQPQERTAVGTQKIRLKFSADSNTAGASFIDDVVLNIT